MQTQVKKNILLHIVFPSVREFTKLISKFHVKEMLWKNEIYKSLLWLHSVYEFFIHPY